MSPCRVVVPMEERERLLQKGEAVAPVRGMAHLSEVHDAGAHTRSTREPMSREEKKTSTNQFAQTHSIAL